MVAVVFVDFTIRLVDFEMVLINHPIIILLPDFSHQLHTTLTVICTNHIVHRCDNRSPRGYATQEAVPSLKKTKILMAAASSGVISDDDCALMTLWYEDESESSDDCSSQSLDDEYAPEPVIICMHFCCCLLQTKLVYEH